MDNRKVSIIVPVFNQEKLIGECIESVLAQTYPEFELILVDDGSVDNSLKICQEYADKNRKIRVIHQRNGGLSDARNTGLQYATGEYITFLDSDDLLDKLFLERMLSVSEKYNADWVQCGALFGESRVMDGVRNGCEKVFSGKEALLSYNVKVRVWGVLYKSEIFRDIRFPLVRIYEDEAIYYKLVYNSKVAVRIEDELYYYYFNRNSLSKKDDDYLNDSFIQILNDRIQYFNERRDKKMVMKSKERLCRSLLVLYVRCKKNRNNKNPCQKYLSEIRRLTKELIFSDVPSVKSKLQCLGVSVLPKVATKISIHFKLNSRF